MNIGILILMIVCGRSDEDFLGSASSLRAVRHGIQIVKVEPFPGLLWISIVPCIRSTRFFTIPMPRPVPSIPLMVEERSREKDSKICAWNSSDIPIPLSAIEISM